MSSRTLTCFLIASVCLVPGRASADGLVIPGIGAAAAASRRTYDEATFPPPPQQGLFGGPSPIYEHTPYREAHFPPAEGRYGGGLIEYVMTGVGGLPRQAVNGGASHAGPVDVAPSYAAVPASPFRASLPRGGLPDYTPQPFADAASAAYGQTLAPQPAAYSVGGYGGATGSYDPIAADPGLVSRPMNPIYNRQVVVYSGRERPGTIVIDTPDKFLYLVQANGQAIRYGIGVGRPGFAWAGMKTISRKAEWPGWTPPPDMLKRRPDLPRHMVGGQANPLGARALYLGSSMYRIHGTNEPYTIGTNVSSGCIRMMNQDVIDLYGRVGVGTHVKVL